jgi:hypothetical protein
LQDFSKMTLEELGRPRLIRTPDSLVLVVACQG